MGYPTSIQSFTNKNAGDVIQPAHVNDLQTEVTAIETGLLNGFSHDLVRLGVSGGSTFSGGLQSSNSTLNALSVSSLSTFAYRPTMPPPDAAKVYLDSTVTLGSSAASTIAWRAQDFLTNSSLHSTTTNPERLTPQSTGIYQLSAQLAWSPNSTAWRAVEIFDSSAVNIAAHLVDAQASVGSGLTILSVTGYKRFDVLGGYAICRSAVGAGVSTLSLSTGSGLSWFAMVKL